jgi:predicted P-loop ATPase
MLGRCIAEGWFGEEAIDDERYNALASEGETQATGPLASNTDMVVADGYGGALTFTKKREPLPRGVTSDKGEKGGRTIHKSFRNCLFLIANEPWDLGFNELTQTFGLRGDCDFPWPANLGYALNDKILREIRLHLLRRWGVEMKPDDVHQAALTLAQRNTFNPAVDYLSDVEPLWDGKSRVVEWLESYMGVEANDGNRAYIRAIGKIVLIAAVRRARQPGCKFDEVLILEGEQGTGKSTAVRILGGEWFNDSNFGSLRDKSAPMKLRGVWIKEIAEMTALSRAETSELKEFTSQQVDRYRAPWGKSEEDYPRRCIFIGSLNPGGGAYLVDLTGNRRFWPVLTGEIDLDGLARDRDQIWAEAAMMETRGDTIRLHPDLYEAAKAEQAARLADEPWVEILSDYLEHYVQTRSPPRATSNELLGEEQALNLPPEKRTQTTMKKLKATMALIPHWTYKPSVRTNGVKTAGYEYTPPPKSP